MSGISTAFLCPMKLKKKKSKNSNLKSIYAGPKTIGIKLYFSLESVNV